MSKLIAMIVAQLALVGSARAQPQPEISSSEVQPPAEQRPRDVGPACNPLGMRTRPGVTEPRNDILIPPPPVPAPPGVASSQQDRNLNPSPSSQGMERETPEAGIQGTQGFGRPSDGHLSPGFFDGQPSVEESPTIYPSGPRDIHAGFGGGAPY